MHKTKTERSFGKDNVWMKMKFKVSDLSSLLSGNISKSRSYCVKLLCGEKD